MSKSLRCRLTGCDTDDCGVCRRCGHAAGERHDWQPAESENPCYIREVCSRCEKERHQPDHNWESSPSPGPDGVTLKCSRCGLTI
jgi:predicted Fe-S protein YdhL (DUF1289 family)